MSTREERGIAERNRRRASMGALEKREAIDRYSGLLHRAGRVVPSVGAKMLAEIWAAKQRLDWGCTPMVTVR